MTTIVCPRWLTYAIYWVAVAIANANGAVMTKLRNSYPAEDIACVLLFPRVFQTTKEHKFLVDQKRLFVLPVFRVELQVDLTVKQVHSEWTYFNCYTVLSVDWKSL